MLQGALLRAYMAYLYALALLSGLVASSPQTTIQSGTTDTITSSASLTAPTGPVIGVTIIDYTEVSDDLVGSIVGVTSSLTTLVVNCVDPEDTIACDFYPPVTMTAGTTTFDYFFADPEQTLTYGFNCTLEPDGGACRYSIVGWIDERPTSGASNSQSALPTEITTRLLEPGAYVVYPVTITAGPTASLSTISPTSHSVGRNSGIIGGTNATSIASITNSTTMSGTSELPGGTTSSNMVTATSTTSLGQAGILKPGKGAEALIFIALLLL